MSVPFALLFLLLALVEHEWPPLIGAVLVAAAGVLVWRSRAFWRHNAEQWRQRRDSFDSRPYLG